MRAARASAFLRERAFVTPDDVKRMAEAVLPHRIILHAEARMNGLKTEDIVQDALQQTKVPVRLER
jgi:MoxR-like ATPase